MVVAHIIGHRLIPLNFRQQRCEADFRFAIARVTDQADPVALMHGEGVERSELRRRFDELVTRCCDRMTARPVEAEKCKR